MEDLSEELTFGALLKKFREGCGLTWKELAYKVRNKLAHKLQINPSSIYAWETDEYLPKWREAVLALAYALQLFSEEADRLLRAAEFPLLTESERRHFKQAKKAIGQQERTIEVPSIPSPIWSVPYLKNPYFTGRETLLAHLHNVLSSKQTDLVIHSQAISGLGGVGKTQIALEYAYQHYNDYKAVFWTRAESRETLLSDFVSIAGILNLPEIERQEQAYIVAAAVKQWFHAHTSWLLILDNIDDIAILQEFMPIFGKGSILITSRMQSLGNIVPHPMEVDVMELEEGMLFLLRRAGILSLEDTLDIASETDRAIASKLVQEMDGLPLALDQAGAFIEETRCSLSRYLYLYRRHHAKLLKRRGTSSEYPQSVATTWSLSFQRVEKSNPIAAEMLRFCAFLHPDAIPEDIFVKEGADLGSVLSTVADDPVALDEAIDALRRYSLIKRNPDTRMLTIHRLVQTVLKDTMGIEQQRQWAERTIRVVNRAFPEIKKVPVDVTQWTLCEQYLSHAQVCLILTEQFMFMFPEAARLLYHTGCYLRQRGRYMEAEPVSQQALMIRNHTLCPKHPDVVLSLSLLAEIYHNQRKYSEAEPLRLQALALNEQILGPEHPDIAAGLNDLARLYFRQSKYIEAEQLHRRALALREKIHGPEHLNVAVSLGNLGLLYHQQGKYAEAEPLYKRAFAIREKILGAEHLDVATSLINLGVLYRYLGKYTNSEQFLQRALMIYEKTLGAEHPDTALSLKKLGDLYANQDKHAEAEQFYKRALVIQEKAFGSEHIDVALTLMDLCDVYSQTEMHSETQLLAQRALPILEKTLGSDHRLALSARAKLR